MNLATFIFVVFVLHYFFIIVINIYRIYLSMKLTHDIMRKFKKIIKKNSKLMVFDDAHYFKFEKNIYINKFISKFYQTSSILFLIHVNSKNIKLLSNYINYYIFYQLYNKKEPLNKLDITNKSPKYYLEFDKFSIYEFENSIFDKNQFVFNDNFHKKLRNIIENLNIGKIYEIIYKFQHKGGKSSSLNTKTSSF